MTKNRGINLIRDGAPRYLQVYEAKKNPTLDCMTIVFTRVKEIDPSYEGMVYYVTSCKTGQAVWQHGEAEQGQFCPGGSRVPFHSLTNALKWRIIQEYCNLWGVQVTFREYDMRLLTCHPDAPPPETVDVEGEAV